MIYSGIGSWKRGARSSKLGVGCWVKRSKAFILSLPENRDEFQKNQVLIASCSLSRS